MHSTIACGWRLTCDPGQRQHVMRSASSRQPNLLCVLQRLTVALPTDHSTLPPALTARPMTLLCGLLPTPERASTFFI